jgi:hypothetical protein
MPPTLQVKINGGAAQTGKVTAAVGDLVQLTAPVNEIASWRSPVARWRIVDVPPTMTVPSGWSTASEGAIAYYYFDGNTEPPPFNVIEYGPHMFDLTVTNGAGARETTRATYLKVPSPAGVELIGYGEPVYTWVKTAQDDARALAGGTFEEVDASIITIQASSVPGLPASTAEVWLNNHNGLLAISTTTGKGYIDGSRFGGTTLSYVLGDVSDVTSARIECDKTNTRVRLAAPTVEMRDAAGINGVVVTTAAAGVCAPQGTSFSVRMPAATPLNIDADTVVLRTAAQSQAASIAVGATTNISIGGNTLQVLGTSGSILSLSNTAINLQDPSGGGLVVLDSGTMTFFSMLYFENSGQFSSATNVVTFSATPMLNCNLGNHHRIAAMTGNITTLDMSNIRDGATYSVEVTQDGAGAHTIAWAAKFVFGDTYTNSPKAAASSKTIWRFLSDGTNVRCVGKETY